MASAASFGRKKYVSKPALSAILDEVSELGLPSATSRRSIKRSRDAELNCLERMHSNGYGHLFRSLDLDGIELTYTDPPCDSGHASFRMPIAEIIY